MSLRKTLALIGLFTAACVPPGVAQIFWSNQSPAGISDDIWSVAYANGVFASVTSQGKVLTSTDGLVWSSQTVSPGTWLVSITYGKGTWVVVGANGTILLSSDLQTWVNAKSATTNKLNGVLYNGTVFVAVGESGTILTSPDAQTWTSQPSGVTGFLHGITYDPASSQILVSGQNGVLLEGSGSGQNFSAATSGTAQDLEAVLYQTSNPLITVAVGANGTIINNQNGAYWYNFWNASAPINSTARFRGLAFGNGYFVAAGEQGTIFTSPDGKSWTQRFSGDSYSTLSTSTLLGAAYSPNLQRFVVVGTGGTILVSNPTPTVFANVSTRGYVSATQTFIGGFVIEGTAARTILVRADGPTLATFGVSSPLPDPVLTVYDGSGNVIATNTGWTKNLNPESISTAALKVGAFALPNPSMDSALLLTLQPGAYTAVITSAGGGSGTALFEAYTD
jgi:hypothetical protein